MRRLAEDRISMLSAWRRGGALAGVSAGGLVAFGKLHESAGLVAIGIAAFILASTHLALRSFIHRCAVDPELAGIAAVRRFRQRLCSPRRRRLITANLRATVRSCEHETRSEFVSWERVRLVGSELLALADELEAAPSVDPRTMVDLDRLLCDSGVSPLLNELIPESELVAAVRSIRFRVVTTSVTDSSPPHPPAHRSLKAQSPPAKLPR